MFEYITKRAEISEGVNEYVLSDASVDRAGDIVEASGWQLGSFAPAALFNHDRNAIIGKWEKVRVEGNRLIGKLVLAEPGTSSVVDMVHKLIAQGMLDGVSVGFRALEKEPINNGDAIFGPFRFKRAELLEASLVSVAANPAARRIMKHYGFSDDETKGLDAKPVSSPSTGPIAKTKPDKRGQAMTATMTLGKRIETAEQKLITLRDQLTEVSQSIGDADQPSEEQSLQVDALNNEIATTQKTIATLRNIETGLATKATDVQSLPRVALQYERKTVKPRDLLTKMAAALYISQRFKQMGQMVHPLEVIKDRYGNDEALQMVTKAAMVIGTTTTSGWASELVGTTLADFLDGLIATSVYAPLSAQGARYTFGRNGIIKIPSRATSAALGAAGRVNGSFVGEGNPIPVRRISTASISLTPKKMAVISEFSKELDLHSTPAIEGVIRQAMNEDTSLAIDAALVGNVAADTVQPAGLLNVAANNPTFITASTASNTYDKMIADIKGLINAIVSVGGGRNLVMLLNPAQALSMEWVTIADGSFPFDSVANGSVRGITTITSASVPVNKPIMIDAADFATVTGDVPEFDVSDQATLHEEDTTPLAIIAPTTPPGTGPAVPSFPVRSLWQTYSIAVRMILPMNWAMRRQQMVATFGVGGAAGGSGVTW